MQLAEKDSFIPLVKSKRYEGSFILHYRSPLTGKFTHVPIRKSGRFETKEAALAWAEKNLTVAIADEIKRSERYSWRSDHKMLRYFNEYSEWRKKEFPRSWQQNLSILKNYGLHFFLSVAKKSDANEWYEFSEELTDWLSNKAVTKSGNPLSVATCIRTVSTLNEFLKWMKRKRYIHPKNLHPLDFTDRKKANRRGSKDLVSQDTFEKVHAILKAENRLFADCWYTQRHLGLRVRELIGLPFNSISTYCPEFIREEFERKGFRVYGSVYLESQPEKPYIKRVNGVIKRISLKCRDDIGEDFSRTIPILHESLWNMLVDRAEIQRSLWEKREFGLHVPEDSYLLFDGAQEKKYHRFIKDAYRSMGLKSKGTHVLRHTLATEWAALKIDPRVAEVVVGHKGQMHKLYVHIAGQTNSERLRYRSSTEKLKKVSSENDVAASRNVLQSWKRPIAASKSVSKTRFRAAIRANTKSLEKA